MKSLLRSPVFPVIFKCDAGAVCAATPSELELYVQRNVSKMPEQCELIDYCWEGWTLLPQKELLIPAIAKKYTKRDLLLLCGTPEDQLAPTNLNKYSRQEVFDFVVNQGKRKV